MIFDVVISPTTKVLLKPEFQNLIFYLPYFQQIKGIGSSIQTATNRLKAFEKIPCKYAVFAVDNNN